MRSLVRQALLAVTKHAARAYVVGPDLVDAIRACKELQQLNFSTTICVWNEGWDTAEENLERYLAGVDALAQERLDSYLSFKVQDFRFSSVLTAALFDRARQRKVSLHFDSILVEDADQVFSTIEMFRAQIPTLGCTLPGRWRRSLDDAVRAAALDLRVRVVTGQWPDPADPHRDPRAGFLAVVDRLAGKVKCLDVATHNPDLAHKAIARLQVAGTPVELELLYGLPMRRALCVARTAGVPVRIYIPYGHAWLPYALGQVRQNPRIALWILKDLLFLGETRMPRLDGASKQ